MVTNSNDRPTVDLALLIVRLFSGVIMFAHGAQKVFGAFGGKGLSGAVEMLGPIGYPVAIGECFGGLGLIVGFLARFSAASNIVIMIGAIVMMTGRNGFFLNPNGFEYNLALIGLLAPTLIAGPGRFSIGRFLPLPKSKRSGRPVLILE